MKRFHSILESLVNTGIYPEMSHISQKEIILSNKLSLILLPIAIFGLLISYFSQVYFTSVGFAVFLIIPMLAFYLNRAGKSLISRFALSVLPQFFLLLPSVLGGIGKAENYLAFSYIFLGFAFIPLFLFHNKKYTAVLALALLINLLVILFYDVLMSWGDNGAIDIRLIENNYIFFKMPQIILWILIVSAFQFVKNEAMLSDKRFQATNNSLRELNDDFKIQNERIVAQNNSLNDLQVKSEMQTNKLKASNNELQSTKIELLKTIDKLKDAREMLLQKEAEAKSIFEALNEHYLVAQYDLGGNLVNINTRVIEFLGVLRNEDFQHIKPVINNSGSKASKKLNGKYFDQIWKSIISGQAHTIDLEYSVGDSTKSLATTFAPLFDMNNKPYKILAIGHDVSELIEKNEKIDKINEELKEKVHEISQQNILLNFQQGEIFDKSEELHKQKEEIQAINESLELRVQERTKVLEEQNKQLAEYAFINSHVLRSPVSTMMGLINLMEYSELPEEDKKVYKHLKVTAKILDNVVFKINNAIDNGFHFDRAYLEPERNFHPMN